MTKMLLISLSLRNAIMSRFITFSWHFVTFLRSGNSLFFSSVVRTTSALSLVYLLLDFCFCECGLEIILFVVSVLLLVCVRAIFCPSLFSCVICLFSYFCLCLKSSSFANSMSIILKLGIVIIFICLRCMSRDL